MSIFTVKEKPAHRNVGFQMSVIEASDLPNVCSQAMKKLEDQPYLNRGGLRCKILHAKQACDAKIFEIFTENVYPKVWKTIPAKDLQLEKAIVLDCSSFWDQLAGIFYSELLESFYGDVFIRLTHDWQHSGDTDDFEIFTKKIYLENEVELISSLAYKFSLSKDIECGRRKDQLSLRVRKSEKHQIVKKMGLRLPEN